MESQPERRSPGQAYLHIGDRVCLFDDSGNGYVGTQGFANVQIGVDPLDADVGHPSLSFTHESIFVLRPQESFSALKEIQSVLDREGAFAGAQITAVSKRSDEPASPRACGRSSSPQASRARRCAARRG